MLHWLREHWFKVGVLVVGLIIAYSLFYSLVVQPQREVAKREARQIAEDQEKQKQREEEKQDRAACIFDAKLNYGNIWSKECGARGLLTEECKKIVEMDFGQYAEERKIPKDDAAAYLEASKEYFKKRDECSCSLPLDIADRLNGQLEKEQDRCLKRFP